MLATCHWVRVQDSRERDGSDLVVVEIAQRGRYSLASAAASADLGCLGAAPLASLDVRHEEATLTVIL